MTAIPDEQIVQAAREVVAKEEDASYPLIAADIRAGNYDDVPAIRRAIIAARGYQNGWDDGYAEGYAKAVSSLAAETQP